MATIVDTNKPNARPNSANANTAAQAAPVAQVATYPAAIVSGGSAPSGIGTTVERTGTTFETALTKYLGGKENYERRYKNASDEDKEKLTRQFFADITKNAKISDLRQFELYRQRCTDPEEYRRLTRTIRALKEGHQTEAARSVIQEGPQRLREVGLATVADEYHHYKGKAQTEVAQLVVNTKNADAIRTAAGHASALETRNQAPAVKIFARAGLEKQNQLAVDKILSSQYQSYANNDVRNEIHAFLSDSKNTGYVEASEFDNQSYQAFSYGISNEDDSTSDDGSYSVSDEEETASPSDDVPDVAENLDNTPQSEELVSAITSRTDPKTLEEMIRSSSEMDQIRAFSQASAPSVDSIKIALNSNPPMGLLSTLKETVADMPEGPAKTQIVRLMVERGMLDAKNIGSTSGLQLAYLDVASDKGDLPDLAQQRSIRNNFSILATQKLKELMKRNNNVEDRLVG